MTICHLIIFFYNLKLVVIGCLIGDDLVSHYDLIFNTDNNATFKTFMVISNNFRNIFMKKIQKFAIIFSISP